MKTGKSAAIVLTYGYLIYEFASKSPSVFVFLFALLFELVLFMLMYGITFTTVKKKPKLNVMTIFVGSIPLLLFSYAMAYLVAETVDPTGYLSKPNLGFWAPVLLYKNQIILVVAGMVISYALETIEYWKHPQRMDLVTSKLVKHGLLIWVLFILTVISFIWISDGNSAVLVVLPLSRILFERVLRKVGGATIKQK